MQKTVITESMEETLRLGNQLGKVLKKGDFLAMDGELGSGKTVLVRGIVDGLGIDCTQVTSPTFVIMNLYQGPASVCHFDAYRLSSANELEDLGFRDYLEGDYICLMEWAGLVNQKGFFPDDVLSVKINMTGESQRQLVFETSDNCRDKGFYKFMSE